MLSDLLYRLRVLFRRESAERELDDELRAHLERQTEKNLRAGFSHEEAARRARIQLGGLEQTKEECRQSWGTALLTSLAQDVAYAIRVLRKNPSFTLTSISVLALAIGANTAMFSVLNAVLLRPLPYQSPDQLAMLWSERPNQNIREGRSAYGTAEQWRAQSQSFADMAVFDPVSATLTTEEGSEPVSVSRISPNFFSLLGIQPQLGRTFTEDETNQRQHVAVISQRFWQARFGGSRNALGATIVIDGTPSQIVGIMPAGLPMDFDLWEPLTLFADWDAQKNARGIGSWFVMGRLRPDVTMDQAQTEMNVIARRLSESGQNQGISVIPLSLQMTGTTTRLTLWMLTGAVFFVLLIAATNVASLSLARSATREREFAVRASLGASRVRILRQLLAENLSLALIAGALGLLVAAGGIKFVLTLQPGNFARLNEANLDGRVLLGAFALSLLTGIMVGLAPAITMARRDLRSSVQDGGRSVSASATTRLLRSSLVVAQFSLAIVLLTGAGLLIRSLQSVASIDPGFRSGGTLVVQLSSAQQQRAEFYSGVLDQVASVPGVESAAVTGEIFVNGAPEQIVTTDTGIASIRLRRDEISDSFFTTLGTPLLAGRPFDAQDRPDSPRVAIVNETMARLLWPGANAVGKRFKLGPAWFTIVGVTADMRRQGLEVAPGPQMFEPLVQNPSRRANLLVRTTLDDPQNLAAPLRAAIRRIDKDALIYGITTLDTRLGNFLAQRRFQTTLLTGFSTVALLMAAIGIYGLIQYSVATRTQEIGVRMAIGAQAAEIFRMILSEGLKLSLAGLAIGLIGALWLGQAVASLLFGVTATDPLTFAAVSLLLTVVATAACYLPARRAMKIEPVTALRSE